MRLLDAVDSPTVTQDLLAIYSRIRDQELHIRLDLLDLNSVPDFDLYLALDTRAGGAAWLPIQAPIDISWDVLLVIPANGSIQVLQPGTGPAEAQPIHDAGMKVLRNPLQDSLEISLNLAAIGVQGKQVSQKPPYKLQVYLTHPDSTQAVDFSPSVSLNETPPEPAHLLLAFWNALPAYTPAQSLRRWDGAHTGPEGGRHGLYNLLRTARNAEIPLVLLDLNSTASLAALDYLGKLDWVKELSQTGLLILPQRVPGYLAFSPTQDLSSLLAQHSQDLQAFGLPSEGLFFLDGELANGAKPASWLSQQSPALLFYPGQSVRSDTGSPQLPSTTISTWKGWRVIPIPGVTYNVQPAPGSIIEQATTSGLSVAALQALVTTAMQNAEVNRASPHFLVLGGNLPVSDWGIPQNARSTFEYIQAHPWIKVVGRNDLLSLPVDHTSEPVPGVRSPFLQAMGADKTVRLITGLAQAPENPASKAAWQAFEALLAPLANPPAELSSLRLNYLEQIYALLAAANWDLMPTVHTDCSTDYNLDSQPDCILASERILALLDSQDGSLTYLFGRTPDGNLHQIIAPSSQFVVGLSDPSAWDLSRGLQSDPAVIPGAFADSAASIPMTGLPVVTISQGELTFSYPNFAGGNEQWQKRYILLEDGLRVEYKIGQNHFNKPVQILLALDPWERFASGWANRYRDGPLENGWYQSISPGVRVEVTSSSPVTFYSFLETRNLLDSTEDPNRNYPRSHYLPLPVGLAELDPNRSFFVELKIKPEDKIP